MKVKLLATILVVLILGSMVSAQGYDIRTTSRNNLRAAPSLDGTFLETVPAGTVLHVVGRLNRWLKISRNGNEVWMADWIGYSRIEGSAGAAPLPASNVPAQVDNCCFVDRQCATDADWTEGWHAFQNGQCAAPAPVQPQTPTQPVSNVPANVDNCCFVDRQCHTPADWENGYYAFRDGQCAAPAQARQQAPAQTVGNASEPIDNCCRVNRQCHSEYDWDQGFYAYLAGECPVAGGARRVAWTPSMPAGVTRLLMNPSRDPFNNCCYMHHNTCHSDGDWRRGRRDYRNNVCIRPAPLGTLPRIVDSGRRAGSASFTDLVNTALDLVRLHAPEWLTYIQLSGVREIELRPETGIAGFWNQQWLVGLGYWGDQRTNPNWVPDLDSVLEFVAAITHEACHAIQQRTYTQTAGWANEVPCIEAAGAAVDAIRPRARGFRWPRT